MTTAEKCSEKLIKENNVAFLAEMFILKNLQIQYCSDHILVILNDQFFPGFFSLAVTKGALYNDLLSYG